MMIQGAHTPMTQQIASFARTVLRLRGLFRGDTTSLGTYLSKCIFYSGMGSNDYLNNYFMPSFYSTGKDYTPEAYADALLLDYSKQLTVQINFILLFFFLRYFKLTIKIYIYTGIIQSWSS